MHECAQSHSTLGDPVDSTLPGSSVHGVFPARILELVAISSSGHPADPVIESESPALAGRFFATCTTWEARDPTCCR